MIPEEVQRIASFGATLAMLKSAVDNGQGVKLTPGQASSLLWGIDMVRVRPGEIVHAAPQ